MVLRRLPHELQQAMDQYEQDWHASSPHFDASIDVPSQIHYNDDDNGDNDNIYSYGQQLLERLSESTHTAFASPQWVLPAKYNADEAAAIQSL
jgi:hypothetical protein